MLICLFFLFVCLFIASLLQYLHSSLQTLEKKDFPSWVWNFLVLNAESNKYAYDKNTKCHFIPLIMTGLVFFYLINITCICYCVYIYIYIINIHSHWFSFFFDSVFLKTLKGLTATFLKYFRPVTGYLKLGHAQ